jgi:hypothetical protein
VQIGKSLPPGHDEIDEALKSAFFIGACEGPFASVDRLSFFISEQVPPQVFEAMLAHERIAFQVKKNVAWGRFRKTGETEPGIHREQFVLPFTGLAGFDLNLCLLTDATIGINGAAIRLPLQRQGYTGQRLHRCDASLLQLIDLELRYSRNETKVIIIAAAFFAGFAPPADIAMRLRIGVGPFRCLFRQGRKQAALHLAKIGGKIGKPVALRLKIRPGGDDIHVRRRNALRLRQQIGIEAKLEDGPCFRFTRQLRLNGLVRPASNGASDCDAAQDVGTTNPALVRERPLRDDLRPPFIAESVSETALSVTWTPSILTTSKPTRSGAQHNSARGPRLAPIEFAAVGPRPLASAMCLRRRHGPVPRDGGSSNTQQGRLR